MPPSAYSSLRFQAKEDAAIWSKLWVGIGFTTDVPETGDILPCTVGHHGIHVQRLDDNRLVGRFNKAQHGGCRVVPLQCQTGAKTRCSFTACGYSRDRKPIRASDPDRLLYLDQYLGLRPERLWPVAIETVGPLILARLDPQGNAVAPAYQAVACLDGFVPIGDTVWRDVACNWKHLATTTASECDDDAVVIFPNVVAHRSDAATTLTVLHPLALDRTLCRTRLFAREHSGRAIDDGLQRLDRWAARAEAAHAALAIAGDRHAQRSAKPNVFETELLAAIDALDAEPLDTPFYRTSESAAW